MYPHNGGLIVFGPQTVGSKQFLTEMVRWPLQQTSFTFLPSEKPRDAHFNERKGKIVVYFYGRSFGEIPIVL